MPRTKKESHPTVRYFVSNENQTAAMLRLVLLAPHTILRNQHHALLRPKRVDNITGGLGVINLQILRGPVSFYMLIQLNIATNFRFLSHYAPTRSTRSTAAKGAATPAFVSRCPGCSSCWVAGSATTTTTTTPGVSHQFNHFSRLVFEDYGEFIAVLPPKWASLLSTHTENQIETQKGGRPSVSST
jgi:hypothetical protein